MMIYAGIGSRKTPNNICLHMERIAYMLAKKKHVLRSGKADGADLAFQTGVEYCYNKHGYGSAEILLPWAKWQQHREQRWDIIVEDNDIVHRAAQVCAKIHPAFFDLKNSHKLLHIRNMFQVLGSDLNSYVDFVIFWAPEVDGYVQGGTASAVHLARKFGIPTFNMALHGPKALKEFLGKFGIKYKALPRLEDICL